MNLYSSSIVYIVVFKGLNFLTILSLLLLRVLAISSIAFPYGYFLGPRQATLSNLVAQCLALTSVLITTFLVSPLG